jgi:hypothetical protein
MLVSRDCTAGSCCYYDCKATKDSKRDGIYTAQSLEYLRGEKEAKFEQNTKSKAKYIKMVWPKHKIKVYKHKCFVMCILLVNY